MRGISLNADENIKMMIDTRAALARRFYDRFVRSRAFSFAQIIARNSSDFSAVEREERRWKCDSDGEKFLDRERKRERERERESSSLGPRTSLINPNGSRVSPV